MTDDIQAAAEGTDNKKIGKLERATGGLNIALGAVLFVDAVIIAVIAFGCLLMSFTLFFMAAIPAFLVTGFLCIVVLIAAVANVLAGIGTLLTSPKREKLNTAVTIATIVLDVAVIPANAFALAYGVLLICTEVDFFNILILVIAVCAILLAVASFILSLVRATKRKKTV